MRVRLDDPASITQVWATAQYLTGILSAGQELTGEQHRGIKAAFQYIERTRNSEGGWGYTDSSTWSVTDIGAWVTLAYIQALDYDHVNEVWSQEERQAVRQGLAHDLEYLTARQLADGSMSVFNHPACGRTYSTLMGLWALIESRRQAVTRDLVTARQEAAIRDGAAWLLSTYDRELGWRSYPQSARDREHIGLTAHTLYVLALISDQYPQFRSHPVLRASMASFFGDRRHPTRDMKANTQVNDSERYICDPSGKKFMETSTFLWYPWTLALSAHVASAAHMPENLRKKAQVLNNRLAQRIPEFADYARLNYNYVAAEGMICLSVLRLTDAG
jgi:hypothetical protein